MNSTRQKGEEKDSSICANWVDSRKMRITMNQGRHWGDGLTTEIGFAGIRTRSKNLRRDEREVWI